MAKITETLRKLSSGKVEEEIITGLRVNLKGTAVGIGLSTLGGAAGMTMGSEMMSDGLQQAKNAGIPFAQQMALGLTENNIYTWKRSAFSGKPKELIGKIPLSDIKDVQFGKGKLGDILKLIFAEDKMLELESVKIDNGEEFYNKLKEMI